MLLQPTFCLANYAAHPVPLVLCSSKTTDHEGRFIPEKFEQIWTKYDSSGRGRLSFGDIVSLVYNQAQLGDVFGM